ncbi:MAG: competence/damage-inducible protein A [Bdellovibrionota bacterium]
MSTSARASILAIGTELTTGQIINRNAPWISERLVNLGIEVTLHETVADDRLGILEALDRCAQAASLVFVTGGLGPTTDDFTREIIAKWLGRKLAFDEDSWSRIQQRLGRMGIPVAESNRQQCYFPEGSEILINEAGTANGFSAMRGETRLWVLPGPPQEVETVWKGGIEHQLRKHLPGLKPSKLFTWQCIGKSEAELGEITEKAMHGSGLQIGYRAHRPFVEVKVWCPADQTKQFAAYFEALEHAISPWVVTRQGEDLCALFLHQARRSEEIEIFDAASGGILTERLGALLRRKEYTDMASAITVANEWVAPVSPLEWVQGTLNNADEDTLTFAIAGFTQGGEWALGLRDGQATRAEARESVYKKPELMDRNQRMVVELAFQTWRDWLKDLTQ